MSVDPAVGEIAGGDVLIEGDRIVQVGKGLSAEGAQVIDAAGDVVIPGFVDTHRHTWETSIRTCAPDYALITYFSGILDQFAPLYRADDVLAANRWGALECINAGITTLVDWSHIMNTRRPRDARHQGLRDTRHPVGVRVRVPEHVAPDVVVRARLQRQRRDHRRRPRAGTPEPGPQRRQRTGDDGASPREARTSASPMWSAMSGSWRRSWASTSRCTWRWTGSATRRAS